MKYEGIEYYRKNEIVKPELEDNHIFSEKVFKSIFGITRKHLKIRALDIRKDFQLHKIHDSNILNKEIRCIMYEIDNTEIFNTLGERTFFELHLIFGKDSEFAREFIKYGRDYKKMAEAYKTSIAYVKMRNIIRLLNNKEKLEKLSFEEKEEDLKSFMKKL